MGFEPTQGDPIGLAGRRLNHSAKVSDVVITTLVYCTCVYCPCAVNSRGVESTTRESLSSSKVELFNFHKVGPISGNPTFQVAGELVS